MCIWASSAGVQEQYAVKICHIRWLRKTDFSGVRDLLGRRSSQP